MFWMILAGSGPLSGDGKVNLDWLDKKQFSQYQSEADAILMANRLANANPGVEFNVFKHVGSSISSASTFSPSWSRMPV